MMEKDNELPDGETPSFLKYQDENGSLRDVISNKKPLAVNRITDFDVNMHPDDSQNVGLLSKMKISYA